MIRLSALALIISLVTEWSTPALASTRMDQDVSDLMNQSINAIQIALDRKIYEVPNPEALLFKHLNQGFDTLEAESARYSPEALSEASLELTGANKELLTPAEVQAGLRQSRAELRLEVARELAELRAKDPQSNVVVKYLEKTQQKLLNRTTLKRALQDYGVLFAGLAVPILLLLALHAYVGLGITYMYLILLWALIWSAYEFYTTHRAVKPNTDASSIDIDKTEPPWWVSTISDNSGHLDLKKYQDAENTIYLNLVQLKVQRSLMSPDEQVRRESLYLEQIAQFESRLNLIYSQRQAEFDYVMELKERVDAYAFLIRAEDVETRLDKSTREKTCGDLLKLETDIQPESLHIERHLTMINFLYWRIPENLKGAVAKDLDQYPKDTLVKVNQSIARSFAAVGGCK